MELARPTRPPPCAQGNLRAVRGRCEHAARWTAPSTRTACSRSCARGRPGFEIVEQPTDEQLSIAAAELRHAARWLDVSRGRTAAVTLCEYVDEQVADPRWQRGRALYVSREATYEISDRVSPPAWWARPLLVARRRRLIRQALRGD